jgi:putative transposase
MAAFIAAQRDRHGIPQALSCRALGVSRSWLYKWRGGALPPRAQRRECLKAEVARLFTEHEGKYGSPRITADLREAGWRVSENTVAALMREQHLAARRKKRRRGTTRPAKGRWQAPDLVKREFPASQINNKWYGDGTEVPTDEGKLYLASVLDMASRRVAGFALGEHHDAQLAYGALTMAVAVRGGQVPGVILHTDQGSENTPPGPSGRPAAGWASASPWAGPAPPWTTRSSNPGTRPCSSNCAPSSTSPPGRKREPGSPPGSMTTTGTGGTPRWR